MGFIQDERVKSVSLRGRAGVEELELNAGARAQESSVKCRRFDTLCEAGLGGNTPEDEMTVFPEFLEEVRKRMAPSGVNISMFDHPRLEKV